MAIDGFVLITIFPLHSNLQFFLDALMFSNLSVSSSRTDGLQTSYTAEDNVMLPFHSPQ